MSRARTTLRLRIGLAILATVSLTEPAATSAAESPKRANVVVVVADDLGFQAGCYGDKAVRTPSIDRLAAAGTRFIRAHCTTASCSASRSVLMTGLFNHATGHYGHSHGTGHFSTYETVPTLPVLLADAGYRTCSIGKYHLAPDYVYKFQTYRNEGIQGARNAVRMARNAKDWIAEQDDRPFFLYFCPSDPHRGGGPDGFANFNDDPDRYPGVKPVRYDPQAIVVPPWLPDRPEVRQELAEYYQSISRLDQGLGVLLDALKETGHWDDTLVLFLSDNGPPFPGAKTTLYEPGMNLPLIVRDPRQKREGGTSHALVSWVDLTPTVLDWCGVVPKPAPAIRKVENVGTRDEKGPLVPVRFHGRSFVAAIGEERPQGFDEIYGSHTFHEITMYYPMRVLIQGNYKYVFNVAHQLPYPFASDLYDSPTWQGALKRKDEYYGVRKLDAYLHRPRHELYDLSADPNEVRNLAGEAAHQQRLTAMQEQVKAWQKRTNDPWVSKWTYE